MLGIASLQRADEMRGRLLPQLAQLPRFTRRIGRERGSEARAVTLGRNSICKEKICTPSTLRTAHSEHRRRRLLYAIISDTLPPRPFLLTLQQARPVHPGPFPSAIRIAVKRLLDHPQAPTGPPTYISQVTNGKGEKVDLHDSRGQSSQLPNCRCSRHNVLLRV